MVLPSWYGPFLDGFYTFNNIHDTPYLYIHIVIHFHHTVYNTWIRPLVVLNFTCAFSLFVVSCPFNYQRWIFWSGPLDHLCSNNKECIDWLCSDTGLKHWSLCELLTMLCLFFLTTEAKRTFWAGPILWVIVLFCEFYFPAHNWASFN